jgi:DNA-binding transcriptional LysR family regulator
VELRHLRYFLAVAEERHFTRAAERLGIQQPPLSRQIRQLEEEIGAPLFRRLSRGVELTESGTLLLDEARRLLQQLERIKLEVQNRARGEGGRISVGFAGATYFAPSVTRIVREFRERHPGVSVSPVQSNTPWLVDALRSREIDIAFIRPPVGHGEGLAAEPIIDEPMLAVLPGSHRLASEKAIALADLAEEVFILFPRSIGPGLYDSLIAGCQKAGFSPRLGQEAPQIPAIIPMVAAGFGVSLVPQSIRQIRTEGAAYVPLDGDVLRAPISLAHRRDDASAAIRNFIAVARRRRRVATRD